MFVYLLIGVGSACGGMARYFFSGVVATLTGGAYPYGTLFVNVTGSAFIGFFATLTGTDGRLLVSSSARQLVMVGICGGYTTFSSFSLETLNLMRDGQWTAAGTNAVTSVVLCLLSVWLGSMAATALNRGV